MAEKIKKTVSTENGHRSQIYNKNHIQCGLQIKHNGLKSNKTTVLILQHNFRTEIY